MTQIDTTNSAAIDVVCVGHASYDLVFSVPHHPESDEKLFGSDFQAFGGGPAANAAVLVARLGLKAAFAGYLGLDIYGDRHLCELREAGVDTRWVLRGQSPTPISSVMVKPNGDRSLVNFKGDTVPLAADALDFGNLDAKVLLFDGHEPALSLALVEHAKSRHIPTVLDAGSLHEGTRSLMGRVDYLVCSEKFAYQVHGTRDAAGALRRLADAASCVVITLGDKGLIWNRDGKSGSLPAFPIEPLDTTGAGDAFHGAFAAALAAGLDWPDTLLMSSAAGALCCLKVGARPGMPAADAVAEFLEQFASTEMAQKS